MRSRSDYERGASLRDGWREVPIHEVAHLNPESVSKKAPPDEIVYVDIAAVSSRGIDSDAVRRLRFAEAPSRAQRVIRAGDTIVSTVRPYLRARALIGPEMDGWVASTGFCVVRPGPSLVPGYLDAVTSTDAFYRHLESRQTGTTYPAVRPPDVGEARIALPPLEEQRRIADLLAAVDVARQAQDRRVDLAWDLLRRMGDLVMATSEWPVRRLDEVAEVGGGITKGGKRSAGARRAVPYLRVANVQHGRLDLAEITEIDATEAEIKKHAVEAGDVLLLEGGNKEDVGRGWIWSGEIEECLHQNHLHRARPNRDVVEPRFLAYAICSKEARAYCLINAKQTSNLATINRTQISGLPVRIPDLGEQRRVVGLLDSLRAEYEEAANARDRVSSLRPALLGVLLSGAHTIPDGYDRFLSKDGALPNLALAAA